MKLSVVAVNYNNCKLLKQSLIAVISAAAEINHEIVVFDNASTDDSVKMLQSEFADVKLITTTKRQPFSIAANTVISVAKGEFVLLIDPAVVVNNETLKKSLSFLAVHPRTGALGVRMINGEGRFLPESKHGLPQEWISFFKNLFLFRFFPKLRISHLHTDVEWSEEFESKEVDVLCHKYVIYRKSALNDVGVFDERFTEYGFAIDLCYRMRLAGYKNYYFAKTHIISYGEAPHHKLSFTYLKNYYGAMVTFAFKYLFKMPAISLGTEKPVSASLYEFER